MSLRQQGLLGWLLPDPIDVAIAAYVAACEADDEGRAAAWAELRARGATCADYVARSERHLASEVGSTRRNASRLLATFVREAPPPPDDCAALAAFCAARADDAPSAEHALRALADVVEAARRGTGEDASLDASVAEATQAIFEAEQELLGLETYIVAAEREAEKVAELLANLRRSCRDDGDVTNRDRNDLKSLLASANSFSDRFGKKN